MRSAGFAAPPAAGLPPPLTLGGLTAGVDVMSNADNVTTTATNTIVASAKAAVSIGRWSNLASIASFLSLFFRFLVYLTANLDWLRSNHTSFPPLVLMSVLCEPLGCSYIRWISFMRVLELGKVTLAAPLSREVGDGFLNCSGNLSRDIFPNVSNQAER